MAKTWGSDITILVASDFNYLPGVYGLYNSAIENGFNGKFLLLTSDKKVESAHSELKLKWYENFKGNYLKNFHRLNGLKNLPAGKYLFLDADFIIERPLGILLDALNAGVIVSTEPEKKYSNSDVLIYRQCKEMNIEPVFRNIEYINCGLLGFEIPRDAQLINDWILYTEKHLENILSVAENPNWFFPEQDILNILIKTNSFPVFSISHRQLELNCYPNKNYYKRNFPYTKQDDLYPKDQLKYLIHCAALNRPWLKNSNNSRK